MATISIEALPVRLPLLEVTLREADPVAKREAWVRRRRRPIRVVLALGLLAAVLTAASVGTWRMVDEVRRPQHACTRQLPMFPDLEIASVQRHWTPPIVRCEYVAAAIDRIGTLPRVNAVTAKNLVVVAALDVLAVASIWFTHRVFRWRRRSDI